MTQQDLWETWAFLEGQVEAPRLALDPYGLKQNWSLGVHREVGYICPADDFCNVEVYIWASHPDFLFSSEEKYAILGSRSMCFLSIIFFFFNIFRVRKMSCYNQPFLLFINYRGERKRCLCCRYLNVDVLECLLKEPIHRHHYTINSDLRLGLNLMVKQLKLKLLCASWPTAILHMWIPSLQQMLANVI